jgi:hypothetical protein
MYSLTLYVYPSPFGVDWRSPHHLARSVILNSASLKPRTIGHVSVELRSDDPKNPERFFTGMSSKNEALNRRLIFREKLGLGVLFYQYDGHLEESSALDLEKEKRLARGNFSFIRFQLSRASYERVRLYLQEYREHQVGRFYGLPHRPRHKEGGGCSAFAASFLEVAGVMSSEFKQHCSAEVRVPEAFLKNVSIFRLLMPFSSGKSWATASEPGRNIFFWDPDMMHTWIKSRESDDQMKIVFEKNTRGILVDSSKTVPNDEPIWLG